MPNTLDQFYKYLAETILNFFRSSHPVKSGDKYFLYLEKEEDVEFLFQSLTECDHSLTQEFHYKHDSDAKEFVSKSIRVLGVQLIVASNIKATENFLTTLRNLVSAQEGVFKDSAIIILFSGKLDSLIGGGSDLTKAGMPFNFITFSLELENKIHNASSLTQATKIILRRIIQKRKKEFRLEGATIFDLATVVGILQKGIIAIEDYAALGLFPHQELESISGEKDKERQIEENERWFEIIELSIKHGEPSRDLDNKLTVSGINTIEEKILDGSWQKIDYADIQNMILKRQKDQPIAYLEDSIQTHPKKVPFWDRPDDETTARKRCRNIIVFNPSGEYPIKISFGFDSTLKANQVTSKLDPAYAEIKVEGKRLGLTINQPAYNENFLFFEYNDDKAKANVFKFKVWALNISPILLEGIEASYIIDFKEGFVIYAEDEVIFNRSHQGNSQTINLIPENQIQLEEKAQLCLKLIREEEEELVPFTLAYKDTYMHMSIFHKLEPLKPIRGWDVWQQKRIHQDSFSHVFDHEKGTFKLIFRNQEYTVRDNFRSNLLVENQIMENEDFAWFEGENKSVSGRALRLSDRMKKAFLEYHSCIKSHGKLPSLVFLDKDLADKAQNYVTVFLQEVAAIEDGNVLNEQSQADLILVGTVTESYGNRIVKLSPLHPLQVAYQLELNQQVENSALYEAVLKKLTPINLVPFLRWENQANPYQPILFASKENNHSPEWLYFSSDLHFKQFGGREFIRDLVRTKLEEFIDNFNYLFLFDQRAPLTINVYNMGDCLQVLQGIFDYYKSEVSSGVNLFELRPINLFIRGSDSYITAFEKMAHMTELEDVEKAFDISVSSKLYDFEDLINAFRSKVHFYSDDTRQRTSYAHVTFYQFDNENILETYRNSSLIPTGLSLNGLLSDIPSYYNDKTYITGFGTNYVSTENDLIRVTKACNALARVAFSKDPFEKDSVLCTAIDSRIKKQLNELYEHSQWVTFVDPHFDLSFFKEDNDLIIIHYSDQYSNSSGFDAITVTRKSKQYQFLLQEILKTKGVAHTSTDILNLIDLYNATNGDWLLKLIGKKEEKLRKMLLSMPSAVKNFLAFFDHLEIIWVPISLEEILRVSGGAGLRQADGLFSTKNLGATEEHCDDLLMIGLFEQDGKLHLQFYPVEVKIGQNDLKKARQQAEKTKQLIDQHLTDYEKPFQSKLYRSFFAKLAIINASKMELYKVWPEQNWNKVTDKYRSQLLNDQFIVTNQLAPCIGEYAVLHFAHEALMREYLVEEKGVLITLLEQDGYDSLIKTVENLKHWLYNTTNTIDKTKLLRSKCSQLVFNSLDSLDPSTAPMDDGSPKSGDTVVTELPPSIGRQMQIQFGVDINNLEPIYWYPTNTSKVMHTNTGIIGTMGTGKTQFTKSLIAQLHLQGGNNVAGRPVGILVFDYKGDYVKEDFVNATKAKVYKLYHLPYNPLAIDVSPNSMPMLPLHIASTLQETISTAFNLGNKQKAFLKEVIMQAYEDKGIQKSKEETWTKTAPTIADVCERYLSNEKVAIDSLHAALNQLYEFEIFQPDGTKTQSLFQFINGVTVINLSGYSEDIQNLVVAITLDAFYSQMQKNGHSQIDGEYRQLNKMVLVDEADNFISKNFNSLRKILKEGREFGVGTILSTQFLDHFSTGDNDYSQYILTWIVHRVNEVKAKEVEALFAVSDKDQKEKLIQTIKRLEKHYSLINLAGSKPILIQDKAFWKLLAETSV